MPDGTENSVFKKKLFTNREISSHLEYAHKKFHQYLYGWHFALLTDHKPLPGLLSEVKAISSEAAAQIQKWAITLLAYNYCPKYRPGSQNSNANLLSRYPLKNTNQECSQLTNQVLLMEFSYSPLASKEISFWS